MDETIHINIEAFKTETHYVSGSKARLWSAILSSLRWLTTTTIPGSTTIRNGIGLIIINNLAISVEGFITDLIIEDIDNGELNKSSEIKKLDTWTMSKKAKMYKMLFQKKIEDFPEYKSIEILFLLRNNISHGRTHTELTTTDIVSGEKTILESVNKNYQTVRRYFVEKGLFVDKSVSSNAEVLWKLNIATFLFSEVTKFLFAVINENESKNKIGIFSELNSVYQR